MNKTRVLIIEDEQLIRWSLKKRFETEGYSAVEADTGRDGMRCFEEQTFDLVMLDYKLPDVTGLDVLRHIRQLDEEVVVIMMTAYGKIETAVEAMRLGAYDFVTKPFQIEDLMRLMDRGLETTRLKRQVRDYREKMQSEYGFSRVVGGSPHMAELFDIVRNVAESGAPTILLLGETGTGKDLLAKTIHYNSDRAAAPFVTITCTAITETLLESELFGHEKGAFTDAKASKQGLFEMAHGGTVYLDEIGDMPPTLQAKLLRFLEDKTFRRVGSVRDVSVDVRIIAATNRDLQKAIAEGGFREDLYHRLNVITVELPPLRERADDLELLTRHFVNEYSKSYRKNIKAVEDDGCQKLRSYAWPGNVRELRNTIERAVILAKSDTLQARDFVTGTQDIGLTGKIDGLRLPPDGVDLKQVEAQLVREALGRTKGNQTQAAKLLHLSRDQLRYRMEKLGLL